MAKAQVTGLFDTKGEFGGGFTVLDPGKYDLELAAYEDRPKHTLDGDDASPVKGTSFIFRCTVVGGPETQTDGSASFGKTFVHTVYIPTEEEQSYSEDWQERQLGELKAILDGFGIKVSRDSTFNAPAAYGNKASAEITKYAPKKDPDNFRNGIRKLELISVAEK